MTCSSETIDPLLPQVGSGTRNTFVADLTAANGGVSVVFGSNVNQAIEENDPTAITNDPHPVDALAPFSGARLNLWNAGYFHNPHVPFPGSASLQPNVHLLPTTGTAGDANPDYANNRGLFFVWRAVDDNAGPWTLNSGTVNWTHLLFLGTTSFLGRSLSGSNPVRAAGGTYAYKDCGINPAPATCGGT